MILEIGGREAGDEADYPRDDIRVSQNEDGKWVFHNKDESP
jgi:uncharacterized cupin superfamily protein